MTRLKQLRAALPWYLHPEGMLYHEAERNHERSLGFFLFTPGSRSALHRVSSGDEIWVLLEGRLDLHVLDPHLGHRVHHLGPLGMPGPTPTAHPDPLETQGLTPTATVHRQSWQGALLPDGVDLAFGANLCAPPFSFDDFETATPENLLSAFPDCADLIKKLT